MKRMGERRFIRVILDGQNTTTTAVKDRRNDKFYEFHNNNDMKKLVKELNELNDAVAYADDLIDAYCCASANHKWTTYCGKHKVGNGGYVE